MDTKIIDLQVAKNKKAMPSFYDEAEFSKFHQMYANSSSPMERLIAIWTLLDIITKRVTPNSACRNKCSHCCYQPVFISLPEMLVISEYTHLPGLGDVSIVDVGSIYATQSRYLDIKCPFLIDSRCSIYKVRPLLCRVYFNLSDTPELCKGIRVNDTELGVPVLGYEALMSVLGEFLYNVLFDIHQYDDLLRG